MVPHHFSNELKPNSGDAASGMRRPAAKIRSRAAPCKNKSFRRSSRRQGFAINKARKPGADVARLVKVARDALRMTADRKGKTAQIRHDCKYGFIGNIVADENRTAIVKWLVIHQFAYASCLV